MKKIINGKVYDTTTARKIGEYDNGGNWGDFEHYEETLYCKRTGEYFLHGEGGAMSPYSVSSGPNSWGGGEKIIPMTPAEAKKWAEEKLPADEYEAEFGDVSEDESKTVLSITMTATVADAVRRLAAEHGTSLSAEIERICAEAVK